MGKEDSFLQNNLLGGAGVGLWTKSVFDREKNIFGGENRFGHTITPGFIWVWSEA